MSKITLEPNSSGAGTFSIVSPDSNTNRTLNLPDESGTLLAEPGGLIYDNANTSLISTNVKDAITELSLGPRVYQALITDTAVINTNDWVELTDFTININAPSSDTKYFITFFAYVGISTNENSTNQGQVGFRIKRNGTLLEVGDNDTGIETFTNSPTGTGESGTNVNHSGSDVFSVAGSMIDRPNTTGSLTYTVEWRTNSSGKTSYLNRSGRKSATQGYLPISTINIMEIREG